MSRRCHEWVRPVSTDTGWGIGCLGGCGWERRRAGKGLTTWHYRHGPDDTEGWRPFRRVPPCTQEPDHAE